MFEIISFFGSRPLKTTASADFFNNQHLCTGGKGAQSRRMNAQGEGIVGMSTWNIINVCKAQMCLLKRTKKVVTEFFVVGSMQNMKQPFLHP